MKKEQMTIYIKPNLFNLIIEKQKNDGLKNTSLTVEKIFTEYFFDEKDEKQNLERLNSIEEKLNLMIDLLGAIAQK